MLRFLLFIYPKCLFFIDYNKHINIDLWGHEMQEKTTAFSKWKERFNHAVKRVVPVIKRPVALLDVDGTLMFNMRGETPDYNDGLIASLKKNGINDVYLLTSMKASSGGVKERAELVQYLQSQGITVHGVVSSCDLLWHKKEQVKDLYKRYEKKMEDEIKQAKEQSRIPDAKKVLDGLLKETPELSNFDGAIPGSAYAECVQDIEHIDDAFGMETANLVGSITEMQETPYETEKGYLYEAFCTHKPDWVGQAIFIDDADSNIRAVEASSEKLNGGKSPEGRTSLFTLYNSEPYTNNRGGTSFKKKCSQDFYDEKFTTFMQQDKELAKSVLINKLMAVFEQEKVASKMTSFELEAVAALIDAVNGKPGAVITDQHLKALSSGKLGKLVHGFVEREDVNALCGAGKSITTVSDFVAELNRNNDPALNTEKRPVALLDVDKTLIKGSAPNYEFNDNLIESLKKNGINDVYLFTDMHVKPEGIEERQRVVEHLESKGMRVHGVITPADLLWHKKDKVNDYWTEVNKRTKAAELSMRGGQTPNRDMHEVHQEIAKSTLDELPDLSFEGATPGAAYHACLNDKDSIDTRGADNINLLVAQINGRKYPNARRISQKGGMYEMFCAKKPDWVGNVVFVDDYPPNIQAVQDSSEQLKEKEPSQHVPLYTLLNRSDPEDGRSADILPQDFYDNALDSFKIAKPKSDAGLSEPSGLEEKEQVKRELIKGLEAYRNERSNNTNEYKSRFMGLDLGKSREEKLGAVDALIKAIEGKGIITEKQLEVLRDGALGTTIRDFVKQGGIDGLYNSDKPITTVSDFVAVLNEKNAPTADLESDLGSTGPRA